MVVVVVVEAELVAAPALVVVVAALVDVVVVPCDDEPGWWPVRRSIASWTFVLTCAWLAWDSLLRSDWTVRVCLLPLPSNWTVGSITPVPFIASTAWVWVIPGAAIVHAVPPLNSMPRLSPPRKTIDTIPRTMISVETANQIRRFPTKSKRVSPR